MSKRKNEVSGQPDTIGVVAGGRKGFFRTRPVELPFGVASVVVRDGLLASVEWERTREELAGVLSKKFPGSEPIEPGECEGGSLLVRYSEGRMILPGEVGSVPLDWSLATEFQRAVLKELASVPYGARISYGRLAARVGSGNAARAVGSALSRNPWPVIVPCHRVVGAGGKMVGFGKGIHAKEALLLFEERIIGGAGNAQLRGKPGNL